MNLCDFFLVAGAFLSTHFNWRMSLITMKMRMGITTAIYRKTLTAQFVDSNSPEVLNLMSTDTDRIVNSCVSFHSFWGIPFQVIYSQNYGMLIAQSDSNELIVSFSAVICNALPIVHTNRFGICGRCDIRCAFNTNYTVAGKSDLSHFERVSRSQRCKSIANI